jgi:Tfp pilus assembly protein PilF/SAM-dependent methyltransferase
MKKIGRNEPCPCGSGKKYKHCCERNAEVGLAASPIGTSPRQFIRQYLQVAIEHHKAGNLAQAEAIYQRILQLESNHPEALHFLGLLARDSGRMNIAVELIRKALRFRPDYVEAHNNLGNTLRQQGKLNEAISSYRAALNLEPRFAEAYGNLGNALREQGELDEAMVNYRKALGIQPQLAGMYCNIGIVHREQGNLEDAVSSFRKALALKPDFAEAFSNLGNVLGEQGKFEQAVSSFEKAILYRPRFPEAYNNMGNALRELGRLDEAAVSYGRAIELNPGYAGAYSNRAYALWQQHKVDEAVVDYGRALELADDSDIKSSFTECAANTYFDHDIPRIHPLLIRAISEPWGRPDDFGNPAVSLIKRDPAIREYLDGMKAARLGALPRQELFDRFESSKTGFAALFHNELLRALMENTPVCDVELEQFLTSLRYCLLQIATDEENVAGTRAGGCEWQEEGTLFWCALARQCFINEYVFAYSPEEYQQALRLKEQVAAALQANKAVHPLSLAAVAAYFPLRSLLFAQRLLDHSWPDSIAALLLQQVQEPLKEEQSLIHLPSLTPIVDDTSCRVRDQYEQNPYPRWIKIPLRRASESPIRYLSRRFPYARLEPSVNHGCRNESVKEVVEVLVAGCGTGRHAIAAAQRFRNANVLAIDLSSRSLCYAKRKTDELGLRNIEYALADILNLDSANIGTRGGKIFDVVEAVGVLHHLSDPLLGWRKLLSLLRPGGFMRIGLYSEYARSNQAFTRRFIAERGYKPTIENIRTCRQEMMSPENADAFRQVLRGRDFYTLSECRDMLFHIQEHCYTLPRLKENLRELGLTFLGFSIGQGIANHYRRRFPDDVSQTDLDHWHIFETENPDTFATMYLFWVQKQAVSPD